MNKVSDLILTACQLQSKSKQAYKVYLYIYNIVFIDMYPTNAFFIRHFVPQNVCSLHNIFVARMYINAYSLHKC